MKIKQVALLAALLHFIFYINAQKQSDTSGVSKGHYAIGDLQGDTAKYRDKASNLLRQLKNGGAVIVRLKVNQKSIDAYIKAGQPDIAHRIEEGRKVQNLKMYHAFKNYFTFCKVYFIYASDTKKCLEGQHVFLKANLIIDSTIRLVDTNFVFCEYGSPESFSRFTDISGYGVSQPSISGGSYDGANAHQILDTLTRKTNTDPASSNALFFSDKDLEQLHRPFPFSEDVLFDNYVATVKGLNREMERAYYWFVVNKDLKDVRKAEKKKQKAAQ